MNLLYSNGMDVSITELRANLASWLDEVQDGAEVTVTDRGKPIARIVPAGTAALIKDLTDRGILSPPASTVRTKATGRPRVAIRGEIADLPRDEWR